MIAQVFGSIMGAIVVLACIPSPSRLTSGETLLASGIGVPQGLITEGVLTFIR